MSFPDLYLFTSVCRKGPYNDKNWRSLLIVFCSQLHNVLMAPWMSRSASQQYIPFTLVLKWRKEKKTTLQTNLASLHRAMNILPRKEYLRLQDPKKFPRLGCGQNGYWSHKLQADHWEKVFYKLPTVYLFKLKFKLFIYWIATQIL